MRFGERSTVSKWRQRRKPSRRKSAPRERRRTSGVCRLSGPLTSLGTTVPQLKSGWKFKKRVMRWK